MSNSSEAKHKAWPYLRLIRAMAQCYQAFERSGSEFHRVSGVTGPQFDIIATLGNTDGMTCKQLGEKTLMTKGTLTGVLDRLEARELIERTTNNNDGRSLVVKLTPAGVDVFEALYPVKVLALAQGLAELSDDEVSNMTESFKRLEGLLAAIDASKGLDHELRQ